jgi:hypothetical protein
MSIDPPAIPAPAGAPFGLPAAVDTLLAQIRAVAEQEPWTVPVAELGAQLVRLQTGIDALTGTAARWTQTFADQDGPADAGAGSLATWLRRELRVTGKDAARRVRVGRLLNQLPATLEALEAGQIGIGHVHVLANAARDLGPGVIAQAEPILLPVAQAADPDAVRDAVKHLRDTLDPDAADEAYVRALDRRDITLTPVGDLYQLTGVLDPVTGQSLKTVLYGMSKPESDHDDRTPGQRRVDALRQLCDERLRDGVPTDHGHRPHLFITITRRRLHHATGLADRAVSGTHRDDHRRDSDDMNDGTGACGHGSGGHPGCRYQPATLHGFGTIGDDLLAQLACEADRTEITVDDAGNLLDVGRTHRLATPKQRTAVYTRQDGMCAAPGCTNTHLELHHLIWWSHGGHTNLGDLAGYCTRCHHLIHQRLLVVTPDGNGGWTHEDRRGRRLHDHRRDIDRANRDHLHHLAHQTFDPPNNPDNSDPNHDEPDKPDGPGDPDDRGDPGDRAPDPGPSPDPSGGAAERGDAGPTIGGSTGPPGHLDNVDPHRLHDELERHRRRRTARHRWRHRQSPFDHRDGDDVPEPPAPP